MRFSPRILPALALFALSPGLLFGITPTPHPQQAAEGQSLFQAQCAACHSVGSNRVIGPGLQGIADRRDREWLVAFITQPDRMVADGDSIAVSLFEEYRIPMPNLGLSSAQAESIIDYLVEARDVTAEASQPAATLPAGEAEVGGELFTGVRSLENGGAACISCHNVAGLGSLGGGTLAKDLTPAATTYGSGLAAMLQTPPFPAMQAIYSPHPLTTSEVANLTAFLASVDESRTTGGAGLPFLVAGLGGMILLAGLAAMMWRGRLRGVRKPLIGER